MATTAYCMKCGHAVTPVNVKRVIYANQRTAERGTCPQCQTTTMKFVKAGA